MPVSDEIVEEETRFETSMTVLAVWLVYEGLEVEELLWENGTCTFFFENTKQLQEKLIKFASGKARVEPQSFSNCFGQITRRMRQERDRLEQNERYAPRG